MDDDDDAPFSPSSESLTSLGGEGVRGGSAFHPVHRSSRRAAALDTRGWEERMLSRGVCPSSSTCVLPVYSRKDRSLHILCDHFLERYGQTPPGSALCLENVADTLGVERRRIYDIIGILESVEVIHRIQKNNYRWAGLANLPNFLIKLRDRTRQAERLITGSTSAVEKENVLGDETEEEEEDNDSPNRTSSEVVASTPLANDPQAAGAVVANAITIDPSYSAQRTGKLPSKRREKSLGLLAQKFLALFLVLQRDVISLEEVARTLLGITSSDMVQPRRRSLGQDSRVRRMYDIANVLSSLSLVEKGQPYDQCRKPVFTWVGEGPLALRAILAASSPPQSSSTSPQSWEALAKPKPQAKAKAKAKPKPRPKHKPKAKTRAKRPLNPSDKDLRPSTTRTRSDPSTTGDSSSSSPYPGYTMWYPSGVHGIDHTAQGGNGEMDTRPPAPVVGYMVPSVFPPPYAYPLAPGIAESASKARREQERDERTSIEEYWRRVTEHYQASMYMIHPEHRKAYDEYVKNQCQNPSRPVIPGWKPLSHEEDGNKTVLPPTKEEGKETSSTAPPRRLPSLSECHEFDDPLLPPLRREGSSIGVPLPPGTSSGAISSLRTLSRFDSLDSNAGAGVMNPRIRGDGLPPLIRCTSIRSDVSSPTCTPSAFLNFSASQITVPSQDLDLQDHESDENNEEEEEDGEKTEKEDATDGDTQEVDKDPGASL